MSSSRPYQVKTVPPIGRTIVAEDHIETQLDLPPLASRTRMGEILSDELRNRGFIDTEDGTLSRERSGVVVEVDTDPDDGGNPTVRVSSEAETRLPPDNSSPCGCRAVARLQESAALQNDLQRQVTARLQGAISKLGCELEGIIHRTAKRAIIERARQLGEVKQITEDQNTGEVTVVVAV